MTIHVTIAYLWGDQRISTVTHSVHVTDDIPDDQVGEAIGDAFREVHKRTGNSLKMTALTTVVTFTEDK